MFRKKNAYLMLIGFSYARTKAKPAFQISKITALKSDCPQNEKVNFYNRFNFCEDRDMF